MARPMRLLADDHEDLSPEEMLEVERWIARDYILRQAVTAGIITLTQYFWATTSDDTPDN